MRAHKQLLLPGHERPRGRPRRAGALSSAERVAAYRARRRQQGERDIHIWLPKGLWRGLKKKANVAGQPLEEIVQNAIVRGLR